MRKRLTLLLLPLLVLFLAACEMNDPPGGDTDPDAQPELTSYSVFGPITFVTDEGTTTGLAGQLAVASDQAFPSDAKLGFAITGPNGPAAESTSRHITTRPGDTHRVLVVSLDASDYSGYEPGEYVIDVFLNDEQIDTITYDLSQLEEGLAAPENDIAVQATLTSLDVALGDLGAEQILVRLDYYDPEDPDANHFVGGGTLTGEQTVSLLPNETFPLLRDTTYRLQLVAMRDTISVDAATGTVTTEGERHTPTRSLRYAKSVELDEDEPELYYNTFTVSASELFNAEAYAAGDPLYVAIGVLAFPLGAPNLDDYPGTDFILIRGGSSTRAAATWREGSRFITGLLAIQDSDNLEIGSGQLEITLDELYRSTTEYELVATGEPLPRLEGITAHYPEGTSVDVEWEPLEGATHYLVFLYNDESEAEGLFEVTTGPKATFDNSSTFPIDTTDNSYGAIVLAATSHPLMPGATNLPGSIARIAFPSP